MAKKSQSKPMNEILERLSMFKYITVVIFKEDVILNESVEDWPLCDCLISFHSKGDCSLITMYFNQLTAFIFLFSANVHNVVYMQKKCFHSFHFYINVIKIFFKWDIRKQLSF